MSDIGFTVRAVYAPWYDGVEVLIRQGGAVGVSVSMENREPGDAIDPTLRIENHAAQTLMDDLWQAGLRPTEGASSAGSLRATEKHLDDMRVIAFKRLGITGQAEQK